MNHFSSWFKSLHAVNQVHTYVAIVVSIPATHQTIDRLECYGEFKKKAHSCILFLTANHHRPGSILPIHTVKQLYIVPLSRKSRHVHSTACILPFEAQVTNSRAEYRVVGDNACAWSGVLHLSLKHSYRGTYSSSTTQ